MIIDALLFALGVAIGYFLKQEGKSIGKPFTNQKATIVDLEEYDPLDVI